MERLDDIADVVNKHSATLKKIAERVNALTKENEQLRNRISCLEKELMARKPNSNPFADLFK